MGLFDFLGGGPERALKKHAGRVADKRAQAPDRAESIRYLAGVRAPAAVEALLLRFGFKVDPSIIDQEEKEEVFNAIVDSGAEVVLEPVRAYLRNPASSVNWGLKILSHLLSADELVDEILALLEKQDTEYVRDPERKQQLLAALEELTSPKIAPAVLRFLEDVNETCRFHAVGALLAQPRPESAVPDVLGAIAGRLANEESMRVRVRIAGGLADASYLVPEPRDAVAKALPGDYSVDREGRVRRKK